MNNVRFAPVVFFCLLLSAHASVKISGNPTDLIQLTNAVANAVSGNTILVSTGTYDEVIDISGITLTIEGGYNHDCTIKVPGGKSRISGYGLFGGRGSVFDIDSSTVTLRDLLITDGTAPIASLSFYGGGLDIRSSSIVTADACHIFENRCLGYGGGVFVDESSLTLLNTMVYSNAARSQTFPSTMAGRGGGIAVLNGTLRLTSASPVFTNEANGLGGGIYSSGGTTLVSHSSVYIVDNVASNGGGLYIDDGYLSVNNGADIGGNTAEALGGGVALVNGSLGVFQAPGTTIGLNDGLTGENQATNGNGGGVAAIDSSVVFSNLAIAGYNNASSQGGAFYLRNSRLTVNFGLVGSDNATNNAVYGGGIAAISSTVEVFNAGAVFRGMAVMGGGLYASNAYVNISSNSSIGWFIPEYRNAAWVGGGIYAVDSDLMVNGSVLNNQAALGGGGGLYLLDSDLVSTGGVFKGNAALQAANLYGGGIAFDGDSAGELMYAQIVSNTAFLGAGIGSRSTGQLDLNRSIVSNNVAADSGGGLFCDANAAINLIYSTITDNRANTNGGGVCLKGNSATMSYSTSFWRNEAGRRGGAVYAHHSMFYGMTLYSNVYITYNNADEGAGIAADTLAQIYISGESNFYVTVNDATGNGGGIWQGNASVVNLSGKANLGANMADQGGGIFVGAGCTLEAYDNEFGCPSFYYNIASDYGGGICVSGALASANLLNTRIGCGVSPLGNLCTSSDGAHGGGGVAVLNGANLSLTNCWVNNNVAYGRGGGVLVSRATMQMGGDQEAQPFASVLPPNRMEANWTTNAATGNGGAIACMYSLVDIHDVLMQSNHAVRGGGLHMDYASTGQVVNAVIAKNEASTSGDGVRISGSSRTVFLHATIVSNDNGEGISVGSGSAALTNCVVLGHTTPVSAGQQVIFSDIQGGYAGVGNLDVEPHFFNPAGSDYRMKYASPCVTSGIALANVTADAIGMARPQGARSDMGAFEYNGNTYDSDLDAMSDAWEIYYTLNPTNAADAAIDTDGDSYINSQEYIADTDPMLPNRYFHILDIYRANTQAVIAFASSASCAYSMECRNEPGNNGSWSQAVEYVAGSGSTMTLTNAEPVGARMYRLNVWRP
ncbi:MAG TPA: hypothetical protein DCZ95_04285 [Verrucomicrobia bacterium]|nr:MAG: hypothetical protein A2X46_07755 [Lentisphaerae bacterium GWF2_57_35]HBA83294.1 hypothetical protein [Verrucomicrobiota bacterium]